MPLVTYRLDSQILITRASPVRVVKSIIALGAETPPQVGSCKLDPDDELERRAAKFVDLSSHFPSGTITSGYSGQIQFSLWRT
jgi:hypothetical protein